MALKIISGFVATTDPIASRGVAIAESALEDPAQHVRDGKMRFRGEHDDRHRIGARVLKVEIRDTKRGTKGVWVELEVDDSEWDGDWRGLSVAVIEPVYSSKDTVKPQLKLAAEVMHFGDDVLEGAVKSLEEEFAVTAGRLYQFEALPPAKVIIDFGMIALQTIPANLVASFLWDSLKAWFLPAAKGEKTVFVFSRDVKNHIVKARVETADEAVLKDAMSTLHEVLTSTADEVVFDYDTDDMDWHQY